MNKKRISEKEERSQKKIYGIEDCSASLLFASHGSYRTAHSAASEGFLRGEEKSDYVSRIFCRRLFRWYIHHKHWTMVCRYISYEEIR